MNEPLLSLDDHLPDNLRVPPNSVEAEQAVLGGLLLNNEAWDEVAERVGEKDFYRKEHRQIFAVIGQLVEEEKPCDLVTVSQALTHLGQLEQIGGMGYLSELGRNTPSAANINAYSDIVRERSILRQLIQVSHGVAEMSFNPKGKPSLEILDSAESAIFEIAEQQKKGSGPQAIKDVLKRAVDRIDELYKNKSSLTGLTTGFEEFDKMTAGLQPADMVVVAGRPSMGKCIVAGSRILDPATGERVLIDDIVGSRRGRLLSLGEDFKLYATKPSAYVDDGMKPVFRVVTALGREIETTLTHPFLSGSGWKPLGELATGDRIAVPRALPVFGNQSMPDGEVKLLAYFIGDGGTTQANPKFTNANPRVREDFIECALGFGGIRCQVLDSGKRTPSVVVAAEQRWIEEARQVFATNLKRAMRNLMLTGRDLALAVGVVPATVSYWLQARNMPNATTIATLGGVLGLSAGELLPQAYTGGGKNAPNRVSRWLEKHDLRGKTALRKTVPAAVFRLPKLSLALFLNRLFACDGSLFIQNGSQVLLSYATSSLPLARDVQHLLLRFGILARLRHKSVHYDGGQRPAYELVVSHQDSLRCFIDEIGLFGKEDRVEKARCLLSGKRAHSNTDSLPESCCDYLVTRKGERGWPEIFAAAGRDCPPGYNPHVARGPSRRLLSRQHGALFADLLKDEYLTNMSASDLYWDKIVAIQYMGYKQVYDLTVPETHNFVAEDMLVHNTTFAMNLCENVALKANKPVLVFSMEMPADSLVMRMLSSLGRINQSAIRSGRLEADDWPRITSAIQMLSERKFFIDDTPALSPLEMRARARRVARECGGELGAVMVDYLQLMQVPGADNRVNEISEISRSLKGLAKELHCPVIALSQLNRSLEQRPNKRPVMSDLRESGAIEQDADLIVFLYRDEVYNKESTEKGIAEIIIGKQRNGPIGTIRLAFRGEFTRFDDLAPEYYQQYSGGDE